MRSSELFKPISETIQGDKAVITYRNDIELEFQVVVEESNLTMRRDFNNKHIALKSYA